jgi:hypothetical protein
VYVSDRVNDVDAVCDAVGVGGGVMVGVRECDTEALSDVVSVGTCVALKLAVPLSDCDSVSDNDSVCVSDVDWVVEVDSVSVRVVVYVPVPDGVTVVDRDSLTLRDADRVAVCEVDTVAVGVGVGGGVMVAVRLGEVVALRESDHVCVSVAVCDLVSVTGREAVPEGDIERVGVGGGVTVRDMLRVNVPLRLQVWERVKLRENVTVCETDWLTLRVALAETVPEIVDEAVAGSDTDDVRDSDGVVVGVAVGGGVTVRVIVSDRDVDSELLEDTDCVADCVRVGVGVGGGVMVAVKLRDVDRVSEGLRDAVSDNETERVRLCEVVTDFETVSDADSVGVGVRETDDE